MAIEQMYIIGFMGAGKSTLVDCIERDPTIHTPTRDTDDVVLQLCGQSPAEIIDNHGMDAFRAAEYEALQRVTFMGSGIIATGGGIVTHPDSFEFLADSSAPKIWLYTEWLDVRERVEADKKNRRPLFDNVDAAHKLFTERKPVYEDLATHTFNTSKLTAPEVVERIKQEILHTT